MNKKMTPLPSKLTPPLDDLPPGGINIPLGTNTLHSKGKTASYKKPEAVKELERLANEDARRRYPNTPGYAFAPRRFRDDTANGLTKCITTYLKLKGAFVSRLNNQGVYDRRLGCYRRGTNRRGLPDVIATYKGKSFFIEVKAGKDRLSEFQKQVQEEQSRAGGLFFVARDFQSFKQWFDNF